MKGVSGGFWLAKPAHDIVLMEIIEAIDGKEVVDSCVLGYNECSVTEPCPLHNEWKEAKDQFFGALSKKNIVQMAKEIKKGGYLAA